MQNRANVFVVHSWDSGEECRRLEELLRASDPDLAHYSVLPERALTGTPAEIRKQIRHRIGVATAVVVLNTPRLHTRTTAAFEMNTAVRMGKRIVVVQPHGAFDQPIPAALDGHVYRFAPWRSDVVGRAIRGDYPEDDRVFDIAEAAERRELVGLLALGLGAASFVLIIRGIEALQELQRDLERVGIQLSWTPADTRAVVDAALCGALVGGLVGCLTRDLRIVLIAAGAGAALGAAAGVHRRYTARLVSTTNVRLLALEPENRF